MAANQLLDRFCFKSTPKRRERRRVRQATRDLRSSGASFEQSEVTSSVMQLPTLPEHTCQLVYDVNHQLIGLAKRRKYVPGTVLYFSSFARVDYLLLYIRSFFDVRSAGTSKEVSS